MKFDHLPIVAGLLSLLALAGPTPAIPAVLGVPPAAPAAPSTAPAVDPALAAGVDGKVKDLLEGSDEDRQAAEDWLLNTPPEALPRIESAAKRPDLDADTRQRLAKLVERLRPLARSRAAAARLRQADFEWNQRTALESYDKVGHHDPKWDDVARDGIRQFVARDVREQAKALDTLEHVTSDLKCDDALILYMDARQLEMDAIRETDWAKKGKRYGQAVNTFCAACEFFEKSDYPADRKCYALTHATLIIQGTDAKQVPQLKANAQKWADEALALWPEVVKVPGVTAKTLSDIADLVVEAQVKCGADRGTVTDKIFTPFEKAMPRKQLPLVFMGRQYVQWAWDARGGGYANTVTPDGWKKMRERLAAAEDVLIKAYDRDPSDPAAAVEMLKVELGQGQGRDVMERWFQRAIAADPECVAAYTSKLYYLEPKWHGSPNAMLAFGRECLDTRDWRGDVTGTLIRAHESLAKYAKDPQLEKEYWHQPAVWQDVNAVIAPVLKLNYAGEHQRSVYAYWAWRCGQWKIADAQFKKLGDKFDTSPFGGKEAAEKAREETAREASAGR